MHYPLLNNYLAYDDQFIGIEKVVYGFNGFVELFKRNDAAEIVIDYYDNIDIDEIAENADKPSRNSDVSLLEVEALELVICSDFIPGVFSSDNIHKLESAVNKIKAGKLSYPDVYGSMSVSKSEMLNANILYKKGDLTEEHKDQIVFYFHPKYRKQSASRFMESSEFEDNLLESYSTGVIYTKDGKQVQVIYTPEMSQTKINETNDYYKSKFPKATYLGPSSNKYNCHSYAWNMTDGGSECWINATINTTNDNISKYWTNDFYKQVSSVGNAKKIFYYNSDHSAVVSTNGMFVSKWGAAPLMRHAPNYGPYEDMIHMNYYGNSGSGGSTDTTPKFTHSLHVSSYYLSNGDQIEITGSFTSTVSGYTAIVKLYSEKDGEEVGPERAVVTRHSKLRITAVFIKCL